MFIFNTLNLWCRRMLSIDPVLNYLLAAGLCVVRNVWPSMQWVCSYWRRLSLSGTSIGKSPEISTVYALTWEAGREGCGHRWETVCLPSMCKAVGCTLSIGNRQADKQTDINKNWAASCNVQLILGDMKNSFSITLGNSPFLSNNQKWSLCFQGLKIKSLQFT